MKKKAILKQIAMVKAEITAQLKPFSDKVPEHRSDEGYAQAMLDYIDKVNKLRIAFDPRFKDIAANISKLGGKGWQDNKNIAQLWLEFAHAAESLRHNPKKGPAAVFVTHDNKLISYAAGNFWLPEMLSTKLFKMKWLVAHRRHRFNICAERAAIAIAIGHDKLQTANVFIFLKLPKRKKAKIQFVRFRKLKICIDKFQRRLIKRAASSAIFDKCTLITTADPCSACASVIRVSGINTIIGNAEKHDHGITRTGDMAKAKRTLSGITRIDVKRAPAVV